MLYLSPMELPDEFDKPAVFVAGGITNCPDWQKEVCDLIDTQSFDVINPRRSTGLAKIGSDARTQIEWEHMGLSAAAIVLFWFPKESICPITLLEYGKMLERAANTDLQIIAGYDPDYQRAFDLEVQTELVSNDETNIVIVEGWTAFTEMVKDRLGWWTAELTFGST